jgi:hypothetical protein
MITLFGSISTTFLVQQMFTSMVMKHNNGSWKIWSFTFVKDTSFYQHAKTFNYKGKLLANVLMSIFFFIQILWNMCCLKWFKRPWVCMCCVVLKLQP